MENENILYIPIQINGGGKSDPTELKHRELYVLDTGKLYVGVKDESGNIKPTTIIGRVVDGATLKYPTLENPKMKGTLKVGQEMVYKSVDDIQDKQAGALYFIDEGNF